MKIVAFMQNMWLKDPESFRRSYERQHALSVAAAENYRSRIIRYALFAGCISGRRLKVAFGDELCDRIIWDETTREVADNPRTILPVDLNHISDRIQDTHAEVIITFGAIARDAVDQIKLPFHRGAGTIINCVHPAARGPDTMLKLHCAANDLRDIIQPGRALI
jgi:hypothetical protein